MSRVFWFTAGAASGVYTLVKAKRTAQNFTPDGVAARLAAWTVGFRMFADEVKVGMGDREHELRQQLGVEPPSQRLLEEGRHRTERATGAARSNMAAPAASPRASA
jgi:hypothetical protein